MRSANHQAMLAAIIALGIAPSAVATPYGMQDAFAGTAYINGSAINREIPGGWESPNISASPIAVGYETQSLNQQAGADSKPSAAYITAWSQILVQAPTAGSKAESEPATPSPPLDLFGTTTDIADAATSMSLGNGSSSVSLSDGVIHIALTQSGLGFVDLPATNGSTIMGIEIAVADGITPTGLIINVTDNDLNIDANILRLSPLDSSQVVFNFDHGTTVVLRDLLLPGALLAPLAAVTFSTGHIDNALIIKPAGPQEALNYLGFNDPLPRNAATGVQRTAVAVPEPQAIAIMGPGLALIMLFGWRGIARNRVAAVR